MFKRIAVVGLVAVVGFSSVATRAESLPPVAKASTELPTAPAGKPAETEKPGPTAKEILTDAAIVALIIAASIAAYKAMGKPCACPSDTMRNGRACGGNSAYVKANGYKPLCYPTDITAAMIAAYRATKKLPSLF